MIPEQLAPPQDFTALRARLVAGAGNLPKRLRQTAAYAVEHPDEIAFGSAASIAARAHVQPSTLVRFAQALGYAGFSELQRVFRSRLRDRWPDYPERLRAIAPAAAEGPDRLINGFADAAEASLAALRRDLPAEALTAAISLLAGARTIYVLGQRRAFPVAVYISYALAKLGVAAVLVDNAGSLGAEQMQSAAAADAVLAISFAPYAPITLELAAAARARGVPVAAITDSAFSPLAAHAGAVLEIAEADYAAFRSLSATLCVGMALAVGIGERRSGGLRRRRRARGAAQPAD